MANCSSRCIEAWRQRRCEGCSTHGQQSLPLLQIEAMTRNSQCSKLGFPLAVQSVGLRFAALSLLLFFIRWHSKLAPLSSETLTHVGNFTADDLSNTALAFPSSVVLEKLQWLKTARAETIPGTGEIILDKLGDWHQPQPDEFPSSWLAKASQPCQHNIEMQQMFEQDQADRATPEGVKAKEHAQATGGVWTGIGDWDDSHIDWDEVYRRDAARVARVMEILNASECRAAADFYFAGMIFHHSGQQMGDQYYRYATFLMYQAFKMEPWVQGFRFGFACAKDRLLRSEGKPQLWGMQVVQQGHLWCVPGGTEDWVTDKVRKQWGLPTMEEREKLYGGPRCYSLEHRRDLFPGAVAVCSGVRSSEKSPTVQKKANPAPESMNRQKDVSPPAMLRGAHPGWNDDVIFNLGDHRYKRGSGDPGSWFVRGSTLSLKWDAWGEESLTTSDGGHTFFKQADGFSLKGIQLPSWWVDQFRPSEEQLNDTSVDVWGFSGDRLKQIRSLKF